ncbi:fasciclin-like arabinogalactan protein 7 [Phragmites australis]|uniref:fasciclin-like arabinogalactan protein 7 n=1 Tax=Phragmites australis TaxID=29695 RepID=UPI002D7686A5|nr:fasciclin-like arabinogalactan protein 7 [Phragmites australis]
MELTSAVLAIAMLCLALPQAALSKTTAPVETPAPRHVNLTDLLSLAGPYGTFLDHLTRTDVIRTFQSQANVTDQGVTIFAPEDSAFKAVDGAALANLTTDQLRSLMLCHAMPRFYPLSAFSALAASSPVPTFAGGQCAVNVTDAAGTIHVVSSWARAKLVSSAYSTSPVAVYSLDRVLLPEQVFPTEPTVAPVPAPAPAPAAHGGNANATDGAPAAAEHGAKSLSCRVGAGRVFVGYMALMVFGFLMM